MTETILECNTRCDPHTQGLTMVIFRSLLINISCASSKATDLMQGPAILQTKALLSRKSLTFRGIQATSLNAGVSVSDSVVNQISKQRANRLIVGNLRVNKPPLTDRKRNIQANQPLSNSKVPSFSALFAINCLKLSTKGYIVMKSVAGLALLASLVNTVKSYLVLQTLCRIMKHHQSQH